MYQLWIPIQQDDRGDHILGIVLRHGAKIDFGYDDHGLTTHLIAEAAMIDTIEIIAREVKAINMIYYKDTQCC